MSSMILQYATTKYADARDAAVTGFVAGGTETFRHNVMERGVAAYPAYREAMAEIDRQLATARETIMADMQSVLTAYKNGEQL